VPPVRQQSTGNILHLAFSLVTPLTPSIVDPVQASSKAAPSGVSFLMIYPELSSVIEPLANALSHNIE